MGFESYLKAYVKSEQNINKEYFSQEYQFDIDGFLCQYDNLVSRGIYIYIFYG